jgi:EmrB/QacA subfamily drug resistance transporter
MVRDTGGSLEYGTRRWLILAVVSAAQFLCVLDLWVVNIALPALQHDFAPATLSDTAWILNVYTIIVAALLIPAGRLADTVGRRRLFLAALAVFGSASLGCALAPTLPVLIVWRAIQALGAAVLLPTSLGLALPAFASHERGTAVGVWAAVGAVAAGGGPVLGGFLVEGNWRWIFLINLPIVLATLLAGTVVLQRDGLRVKQRVDAVGTVLVLGAMGLVCAGLIEAPSWPALTTWSILVAGLLLTATLVGHTVRHPAPVIPPRMFAERPFSVGAVGLLTYYVGFGAMLLGTTLLLTQRLHFSVLDAALGIAPGPITAGIVSLFSGRLAARMGVRTTIVAGAAAFGTAGAWPLVMAGEAPTYLAAILPSMVLWGIANALIQPTLFAAAADVPHADLAASAAVLTMARQLGSALGVALLVVMLGAGNADGLAGFRYAWSMVIGTAAFTGVAGLFAGKRRQANRAAVPRNADPEPVPIRYDSPAA